MVGAGVTPESATGAILRFVTALVVRLRSVIGIVLIVLFACACVGVGSLLSPSIGARLSFLLFLHVSGSCPFMTARISSRRFGFEVEVRRARKRFIGIKFDKESRKAERDSGMVPDGTGDEVDEASGRNGRLVEVELEMSTDEDRSGGECVNVLAGGGGGGGIVGG